MHTKLFVIVIIAMLSTACAVPIGHGRVMYPFGEPQKVIIHSNGSQYAELEVNGRCCVPLPVGGTYNQYLSYDLRSNVVITVKVYDYEPGVRKVYLGTTSRTFVPSYGNYLQEWTVDYVQPRVNQFSRRQPAGTYGGSTPPTVYSNTPPPLPALPW